jgi:hypothetical protein
MATLGKTTINDTGFLTLPVGNTAQRPASPTTAMIRWNSQTNVGEFYDGTGWAPIGGSSSLYAFTNATFTSGGQTEQSGPSLAQARSGLTGTNTDAWKNNTSFFNVTSGVQIWTVPAAGNYRITAAGARGGGNGGNGAIVRATYTLLSGELIYVLPGQTGNTSSCGGGGGGGTYVARARNEFNANFVSWAGVSMYPLLVGGGGGGQSDGSGPPQPGSMGTFGTFDNGSVASNNGNGGPGGSANGGGGWSGNGGTGSGNIQNVSSVGQSFISGAVGGNNNRSPGKFGGGSGATCEVCNTAANAGAGGGYSGGGTRGNVDECYRGGGGGGSFIHSTAIDTPATSNGSWSNLQSPHSVYSGSVSNFGSFNTGTGYIIIEQV